ncbi:Tether containing UBX domain for GLUT4 [Geodia barretti]|uniref:Tether containing UBX domain for GLUT4 n=1 Tax=Geodia barretti TaxID=519541 RepID=A0AA35QTL9_GEOBA|nr:Tether containing UBX domain for GLUT4 [Geodia barretti]
MPCTTRGSPACLSRVLATPVTWLDVGTSMLFRIQTSRLQCQIMRTSSIRCTPAPAGKMWQVTVLCPRARRCNLKVTPNTVLLQVLEQACSKQKLDPALYTIKHHGKLLDLSLSLRFSGIPNNGKVELVVASRPRSDDGEVVVAVQNVDGTRFQSSFHSTTSLWDVLIQHKLDSSPGGMEPSLSYMRQEVSGEKSLRTTQLRSIGLSSGRGLLRLSHRTVSQSEEDAEAANPTNTRKQENTKGEIKSASQDGGREEEGRLDRRSEDGNEPRRKPPPTCGVAKDTTEGGEELPYFPAHPISYFPREEDESPGGPDRMEGVEISNSSSHFSPDPQSSSGAAMALISGALQQPHNFPPEVVAAQLEEVASSPFSQFAGVMRPHPLAPPMSRPQLPKVYDEPCHRERVVYSLDDPLPLPAHDEVSASFFEHTVTDIHVIHSDLKRQASASDAPLMTRAMRAVRDEMRLEKYEKSVVRVYFPDRWVLQGCFRPQESLKMLVNFIRENLADPNVKFHLCEFFFCPRYLSPLSSSFRHNSTKESVEKC